MASGQENVEETHLENQIENHHEALDTLAEINFLIKRLKNFSLSWNEDSGLLGIFLTPLAKRPRTSPKREVNPLTPTLAAPLKTEEQWPTADEVRRDYTEIQWTIGQEPTPFYVIHKGEVYRFQNHNFAGPNKTQIAVYSPARQRFQPVYTTCDGFFVPRLKGPNYNQ